MVTDPEFLSDLETHLKFLIENPAIHFKDAIQNGLKTPGYFFQLPEESGAKRQRTAYDEVPWGFINVGFLHTLFRVQGVLYGPNDITASDFIEGPISSLNSQNPLVGASAEIYRLRYPNAKVANNNFDISEISIVPFTQFKFFGGQIQKYEVQGKDYYALRNNTNFPIIMPAIIKFSPNMIRSFSAGGDLQTSFSSEIKNGNSGIQSSAETFGVQPCITQDRQDSIVQILQNLPNSTITQLYADKMYLTAKNTQPVIHFPSAIYNKLMGASEETCLTYSLPHLTDIDMDIFDRPNNKFGAYFGNLNDDFCDKWRKLFFKDVKISDMSIELVNKLMEENTALKDIASRCENIPCDKFRSFKVTCLFIFFMYWMYWI